MIDFDDLGTDETFAEWIERRTDEIEKVLDEHYEGTPADNVLSILVELQHYCDRHQVAWYERLNKAHDIHFAEYRDVREEAEA